MLSHGLLPEPPGLYIRIPYIYIEERVKLQAGVESVKVGRMAVLVETAAPVIIQIVEMWAVQWTSPNTLAVMVADKETR